MMSADECVNRLVHDFFQELRADLREERMLLQDRDERQRALLEDLRRQGRKEEIGERYGISKAYFKSLVQMQRKVTLSDLGAVVRWMQSHVDESPRGEVSRMVKDLLPL